MPNVMRLEDETTWPSQVIDYMDRYSAIFLNWKSETSDKPSPQEYDQAIYGLRDALRTDHVLSGYHCTRLTNPETQYILENGMQLPNREFLYQRIISLEKIGLINNQVAEYLKNKNQSNENNRKERLWFCFNPPYLAGQRGIERFFRSWGGEALYNSHERDSFSGPILNKIGIPCIVEAHVPIANLADSRIDSQVIGRYLINRGLPIAENGFYEDQVKQPISPQNIFRIIKFPSADFIELTKCDFWKPPLLT